MARTTTDHTIVVQSALLSGVVRQEEVGTGSIYPGLMLMHDLNGYVAIHNVDTGANSGMVALESQTPDTNTYPTTASTEIPYTDHDTVYYAFAMPGDIMQVRLKSGSTVVKGRTWLGNDGNGQLKAIGTEGMPTTVGTSNPVGVAWESIASCGSGALCRVKF